MPICFAFRANRLSSPDKFLLCDMFNVICGYVTATPFFMLQLFGSFPVGLHVRESDLDVVISDTTIQPSQYRKRLRKIGRALKEEHWIDTVEVCSPCPLVQ